MSTRVLIFAKAPAPGLAKTRLIPALGADGAARLAARMLDGTVAEAIAAGLGEPELCATPDPNASEWRGRLPDMPVRLTTQGQGDLGERLARAAARAIGEGERVLLIGTDCPTLDAPRLRAAAEKLETHDAVIYPASDGGYVLLGLRRFDASLFADIPWSTSTVAAETSKRLETLGWTLFTGETLKDVDEPADLEACDYAI